MKSITTKLMMTAAVLTIATTVASAQTYRADIPFAFRAGAKMMASGSYQIRVDSTHNFLVVISNYDARQAAVLLPNSTTNEKWSAPASDPVLSFECASSRCALARLSPGYGNPSLNFHRPALGKQEQASAPEIRLVKISAD